MVHGDNHAATNGESTFAVNLLPGEGAPPVELAGALGSLSEAFEHAAEWLDREDASRLARLTSRSSKTAAAG
jgi:hypothetical protein